MRWPSFISVRPVLAFGWVGLWFGAALAVGAAGSKADYERAHALRSVTADKVFRDRVTAHWLPDGQRFWYRVRVGPGHEEVVLVDAVKGSRTVGYKPEADAEEGHLSAEGPRRSGRSGGATSILFTNTAPGPVELFWLDSQGAKKPYGKIASGGELTMSTYAGHRWLVVDAAGRELGMVDGAEGPLRVKIGESPAPPSKRLAPKRPRRDQSPDGEWVAFIEKNNILLRHQKSGEVIALSSDGSAENRYEGDFYWSPDSKKLVVMQVKPAQQHKIHMIESSPPDRVEPVLHEQDYLKAGDRIRQPRPRLFDIAARRQVPVSDALFPNPWALDSLKWDADSARFTVLYNERGHQTMRLLAIDAAGAVRVLIEETSPTFIDYSQKTFLHPIAETQEAIWMSERDGWNHLYLYDLNTGKVKNAITHGEWVVRNVEHVDEQRRELWFTAMGVKPGEDPYHIHLCRVGLDGSGFRVLTEGDGTHEVKFSPDRRWFVDTWSRVDQPPVAVLRASDDGHMVCELERADGSALLKAGWAAPERFVAKGRDGRTNIYGVIYKPSGFDAAKSYPVIEEIYAGPHGFFVPKAWGLELRQHAMAELGFIVVQIDGMGTNWRSRAFHDVAWRNLKDAGLPDRIAWMKSAASTRPWMDLARVGIYGGSAGGQNALAALLHHGDFYRAGVADCGCHDNRMDKIWWNEAWLGWPVGPWYADNSNVTHAAKLRGKLMLIVGEIDSNVDPASTMQVVNALVKADRDFELLVMPGTNHGAAETPYASRRRMDFFVKNLLGVEPRHISP